MILKFSTHQKHAYRIGAVVLLATLAMVLWPGSAEWAVPGPDNVGHAELNCEECHRKAPGTIRQQIQANFRHLLGRRSQPVSFGRLPASNAECLSCHDNETDAHPVYRFEEPRFQVARQRIAPQYCSSCHRQHQGKRVTAAVDVCSHCHAETTLREDPLDVSHRALIDQARWETCLGCHDFHGNHAYPAPQRLEERLAEDLVLDYLDGGLSPYGSRVLTVIQTMRSDP